MADKTLTERLQPSLLDRLTDLEPTMREESRDARVIDLRRLREIVQRDLSWLLNTSSSDMLIDEEAYPYASRAVLNYGVREVAGGFSNVERAEFIRSMIARAIENFEPRIVPETLIVKLRKNESGSDTLINYDIVADMWAQPVPMELYLRSQVDLASGELSLERVG
jgi:type VI secretion system protein ImpF